MMSPLTLLMKLQLKLMRPATLSKFLPISLSILLLSSSYAAFDEPSDSDCQCRAPTGDMKNLGTVQCINVTGQRYLVRCEMSMNTPYWNKLEDGDGCPIT